MSESRTARYADFRFGAVLAAVGIALTAGFGYAAVLSVLIGFEISMGDWWPAMLQAHGHAQLFGWAGLFIVGVSLYFIPRLAGAPLPAPRLAPWAPGLLAAGILLRSLSQPLLDVPLPAPGHAGLRWVLGLSALAEAGGVALYLALLLGAARRAPAGRPAFHTFLIFLLMAVCGWVCAAAIGSALALRAAWRGESLLPIAWNRLGIDLFIGLVLIPVAMAFSIRTFPLYLRLPAVDWPVRPLGLAYLFALLLIHVPLLAELLGVTRSTATRTLPDLGQILKGLALLAFTYRLDLLFRRRPPWTVNRIGEPGPERRPTRPGLPDYGEFGRFEWLLYGAYICLALGALLELVAGTAGLIGIPSPADPDAVRHTYLLGFVTMLLLGMAPRMIPGFLHRRQVAHPELVAVTFYLAAPAVLFRVLPLLLAGLPDRIPGGQQAAMAAFGLSGILGWTAAATLGYNLWATWRGQ